MSESVISVIIPFYNASTFFEECILSVLNQEKVNIEIIVVDDGSSASEKKFISIQQDKYGFKLIHQENKGVSAARNTGLFEVKGDRVLFLDADDELEHNALYDLIKECSDVVVGNYQTGAKIIMPKLTNQQFIQGNPIQVGTALIKVAVARQVGGFNESLAYSEDMVFWFRLWEMDAKFMQVNHCVLNYRIHEHSSMKKKSKRLYDDNALSLMYRYVNSKNIYACEDWFNKAIQSRIGTIHWYARENGIKGILSNYRLALKLNLFLFLIKLKISSDWRYFIAH
jgi:glycosyltransferase involved in cell wall biosynthesis